MKTIIFLAVLASATSVFAQTSLTSEFKTLITRSKIGKVADQSYCFIKDNTLQGYQPAKIQRIASVTKVISTLLASETLDLHMKFRTKVFVGKDSIHIEGGKDPYFEEDKVMLLMKGLNDLGIKSVKKVTFTPDFHFNDLPMEQYEKVTPERTRARLAAYLSGNTTFLKATWKGIRNFAAEENVLLDELAPVLTAESVTISAENPLLNENPAIYVHDSLPFHELLKSMNVQSKNYVAENVYLLGSAIKPLGAVLTERGIDPKSYLIYTGSGLPVISGQNRVDNLASCATILKVVGALSESLKKHNLKLSDVMAVNGGKDRGSFKERFKDYPETHEAVISKTGTLKQTSTLAGVLLAGNEMPFAILNHTTNAAGARKFQDRFVARMFDYLGPATPMDYIKISIFPWDGSDFLKSEVK